MNVNSRYLWVLNVDEVVLILFNRNQRASKLLMPTESRKLHFVQTR